LSDKTSGLSDKKGKTATMTTAMDWKVNDGAAAAKDSANLVEIKNLYKYFPVRGGLLQRVVAWVQAVDNVSFAIKEGETLGMVGESGCGKTTVGRTLLRLVPATSGQVLFEGQDVFKANGRELKNLRRNMQIIFQDPYSSSSRIRTRRSTRACRSARASPRACLCTAWAPVRNASRR